MKNAEDLSEKLNDLDKYMTVQHDVHDMEIKSLKDKVFTSLNVIDDNFKDLTTTIESNDNNITEAIRSINNELFRFDASINEFSGELSSIKNDLSTSNISSIPELSSKLLHTTIEVDNLKGNIGLTNGDVALLNKKVDDLQNHVDYLVERLDTVSEQLETILRRLDRIESSDR